MREIFLGGRMRFIASLLILVSSGALGGDRVGFIFFGDQGTGEAPQYEVALGMQKFCEKNLCQFALLLGDNFYPEGVNSVDDPQWLSKFETPYTPLKLQFFASLGNHDYGGNVEAQVQYSKKNPTWVMPSRYYKFTKGNIDFLALDTEKFGEKQDRSRKKA